MKTIFGNDSPNMIKKWNLSDYVSSSSPRLPESKKGSGVSTEDLGRTIRDINQAMSKLQMQYDKLYRQFDLKRSDLKKYIRALIERDDIGETLSMLENADISVIVNQMRVLDAKTKLTTERFKQIRDEKKQVLDILKATGNAIPDAPQVQISNSPLSVGQMTAQRSTPQTVDFSDLGIGSPNVIQPVKQNFDSNVPAIESKSNIPVPAEKEAMLNPSPANQPIPNEVPEPECNPTVTMKTMMNTPLATQGDHTNMIHKVMMDRIQNKDRVLENTTNMLGHDLKRSLVGLGLRHKDYINTLRINVEDGTFYEVGYEKDENGNYTKQLPEMIERGVMQLGALDIDIMGKQVTTYYEEDPIPFEIVHDNSGMSEFYRNEWNSNKTDKFRIPEEVCEQLKATE